MQSVFEPTVFATTFMTLLVIQDPLGAIPIFLSLTSRQTPTERAASARQATVVSFGVILLFAVFGRYILKFLGISVPSLQVAGGLLLLLVALELLTDKADESPDPDAVTSNAALVPLGTPLLAGPGAIVAAMVAVDATGGGAAGWVSVTAAIIGTHIVVWISLRFSLGLNRVLGTSGIRILTRVMGLLLAAIAVQIMADGVFAFLETRLGSGFDVGAAVAGGPGLLRPTQACSPADPSTGRPPRVRLRVRLRRGFASSSAERRERERSPRLVSLLPRLRWLLPSRPPRPPCRPDCLRPRLPVSPRSSISSASRPSRVRL